MSIMLEEYKAKWQVEGEARGEARGRTEGRTEGRRQLLTKLLAKRFGPLSNADLVKLAQASPETLERWADRLLDVETLADLWL